MKNIRYFFEGLGLHAAFLVFRILPPHAASNLGGWLGRTIGPRLAASRKALKNIQNSLPNVDPQAILTDMWDNLGRTIAEYPHLKTIARDHTEVLGQEHALALKNDNEPGVLFAGHLGNWEVGPTSIKMHTDLDIDVVYRPPNNPWVEGLLDRCRSMNGLLKTIPKSRTGARQIIEVMKTGRHLGILIDQKYNEGVPIDFFGRPAMTSPVFVTMAQKFGTPLIPVQVERLEGCTFRVTLNPPMDVSGETEDVMRAAHILLENWISKNPGQWLWLHRRWDSASLKEENEQSTPPPNVR